MMRMPDRFTGLLLAGLGGLAALVGGRLPPVPGQQVGPNVFPMVIGAGLVLCGLLIAAGVGRGFEDEAQADLKGTATESGQAAEPAAAWSLPRLFLPPGLLVFYVVVVDSLGFVPTAAIIALTAALGLGARPRLALPLAALAPIGVHLVFSKLLRVPLPPGLLPMPW